MKMRTKIASAACAAVLVGTMAVPAAFALGGQGSRFVDADGNGTCDNFAAAVSGGTDSCTGMGGRFQMLRSSDNAGTGSGYGYGNGAGTGSGAGYVDADGDGICDNAGTGSGYGYGNGAGTGSGAGYVDADGDGICDNAGTGSGSGSGDGQGAHHGRRS